MQPQVVGIELSDESVKFEKDKLVGRASLVHRGKIGGLKLTLEGDLEAKVLIHKGIDLLEKAIPGDQKAIAQVVKEKIDLALALLK